MTKEDCSQQVTDTCALLQDHVHKIMDDVVKSSILREGQFVVEKLQKPRLRAQGLVQMLSTKLGEMERAEVDRPASLTDMEVQRCAAIIVSAFLNPVSVKWDYDRFAESQKKRASNSFFIKNKLGTFSSPTTIVDIHGKILVWFLPGLLLPHQVGQFNSAILSLKCTLNNSLQHPDTWREKGFISGTSESIFGAGRIGISVGRLIPGHKRLIDALHPTPNLKSNTIQNWLQLIKPLEHLLDAVLQIIHPEMWIANSDATQQLIHRLQSPLPTWPSVYGGMDVIVNRVTPSHCDGGGAFSFYDHLLSLGWGHDAKLKLDDLNAEFDYPPGTGVWLTGRGLSHSVPQWTKGERVVVAHYAKDDVHDRLGIPRPSLPTQAKWLSEYLLT